MVSIAQHLGGVDTWPGLILTYSSPAVAVIFGAVVVQLTLFAEWTWEWTTVRRARKTLRKLLKDPNTSEDHKAHIRAQLERLDKVIARNHVDRVEGIK
ncbi:hypothetical protein DMB37_30915 [Nocardia sp. CS682]|nr:hypothetical protein DMB37_30915 [Nocardia sp. CS682]